MQSPNPHTGQDGRSRPSMRVRTSFVPSRGQHANVLAGTQAFARRSFRSSIDVTGDGSAPFSSAT